ncbi:hypothetical protein LTR56_011466 [Elasticomyces elasticus]|nr:hypothetical protein LTR56_011466 [Elasticomyces elasticus]KAK3655941.1 hypothetical protein LTR22_009950 [Elasticomyces elasticus]KAK4921439.1 hypothetical protein LTR49_011093 [Elasticomyces elasticus]KAK5760089.1 hypothetical protein LTS12_009820 [Elasticomyces elasticus]
MATAPRAAEAAHYGEPSAPVTGLFKLPAELRLQIYGLVITKLDRSNIEKRLSSDGTQATIVGHMILPSLMRVSRQIREDAIGLYQQHLQDARVVLTGRREGVGKFMISAEMARHASFLVDRWELWNSRVDGYSEQLEDDRMWMVRVDQVAAQVTE